jgi:diguanylate cyclase (GGDEF)-like protein
MSFETPEHGGADPALSPAVRAPGLRGPRPLVWGVDRGVAVLALAVAAALIAGLAWNLVKTQGQARDSLDDAIQRRAGLTADVIGSAFMTSRPPALVRKEFGGGAQSLRRAVEVASVTPKGNRVTVLDAGGRVLATAGAGRDPDPSARRDAQLALRGTASLSDAFGDGRGGQRVELAVPYPSASGRRVLLTSGPVSLVQGFTQGFFVTPSAFSHTQGYLIDGAGRTLSSTQPRPASLTGPMWSALAHDEIVHHGGRTFVSGNVPSSRWRVVLSVPNTVIYASVDGAPANAAWLSFGAFAAAICALLGLGLLAARSARRLAAANRSADASADLAHERLHDPLTGLANRALFAARAEQAVVAARRHGRSVAVVFIDIDHYKLINDSLGHDVGDEVLREVARRLTRSVRGADTVSRFGGDEFVVLCDELADASAALRAVERIRAGLEGPVDIGDRPVPVTFSIGLATAAGGEKSTAAELLANADTAMYRAKELGRDRVEIFDAELQRQALIRLDTEVALRSAVKGNELLLHYQPIVDLTTNKVCGVEALLRWRRTGTDIVVQPDAFIRVAEDIGMIGEIGEWVLLTATAEVGEWVSRGLVGPDFVLSVNVSARQLADPEFPGQVTAAIFGWGRPADRLWLEITETAVMADPSLSEPGLKGLQALGVGLALDDFGSGYSSLGKLARALPVSILKLDRSFVFAMADRRDHEIVAAAAALANALELVSVAEGVESAEQALAVTGVGFRYAQGFYFGTPADADEAVRRLGGGRFGTRRTQAVPKAAAGS